MRIPFGRVRGSSIASGMPGPTDLLIATPRRIDAVRDCPGRPPRGQRAGAHRRDERGLQHPARAAPQGRLRLHRAPARPPRSAAAADPPCAVHGRGAPHRAAGPDGLRHHLQERVHPAAGDAGRPLEPRLPPADPLPAGDRQAPPDPDPRGGGRRGAPRAAGPRDPRALRRAPRHQRPLQHRRAVREAVERSPERARMDHRSAVEGPAPARRRRGARGRRLERDRGARHPGDPRSEPAIGSPIRAG